MRSSSGKSFQKRGVVSVYFGSVGELGMSCDLGSKKG